MNASVARAVQQIRASFPDHQVVVRDDGEGGAYVIVEDVALGAPASVPRERPTGRPAER